jgi:phosphate starvation-inducible PhoH-like protein
MSRKPRKPPKKMEEGSAPKNFSFKFLSQDQHHCYRSLEENDINFLTGIAGTGKTFLCAAFAINQLLNKKIDKIYITRPLVEAGEKLGFLPGDINEKTAPYLLPLYSCFDDLVGKTGVQRDIVNDALEIVPLAFMRGITIRRAIGILDEAQNCTYKQLKLFLTRIGMGGKLIINGDLSQIDLMPSQSGLKDVIHRLKDVNNINMFHFDEANVVRHPMIQTLSQRLP